MLEGKYKLTLVNMEKRFVDIEAAISELREKFKGINFEAFPALQQRVDDIEDLIMVEQAGIMELKKIMIDAKNKFESAPGLERVVSLEEKLSTIEKRLSEIKEKPQPPLEVLERMKRLESDIAEVKTRPIVAEVPDLSGLRGRLNALGDEISTLKASIDSRLKALDTKLIASVQETKPTADYEFVLSKIESLKAGLNILTDKKVETDLKIAGLEEKDALLENRIREALSQKFIDAIKLNKRDIMAANVRMESVEKVLKELSDGLNEIERTVKKFESFERLGTLEKSVEEKLERFKFIEDETRRLSNRVEMIYDDLDKRLEVIKDIERNFDRATATVTNLTKEMEKNRFSIQSKVDKTDMKAFEIKTEDLAKELEKKIGDFENRIRVVNKASIEELAKRVEEASRSYVGIDERMKIIEVDLKSTIDSVKSFSEAVSTKFDVKELKEVDRLINEIKNNKNMIEALSKEVQRVHGRIGALKDNFDKRLSEIKSPALDQQMVELIDKVVFLETRLGAVESIMQKTQEDLQASQKVSQTQPIILE